MQWDYGFDFGADSVKYVCGTEIKNEAAYAAYRPGADMPFARGDRAFAFVGRESRLVKLRQPMRGGVPVDVPLLSKWAGALAGSGKKGLKRRRALFAVSPELSESACDSLLNALIETDIDTAGLVRADTAAALGAGIDINAGEGTFVMDIGASHITFSVFAGGRCVLTRTSPGGMQAADAHIAKLVRTRFGLMISPRSARRLKLSAFSAKTDTYTCEVFDPAAGLPRTAEISVSVAEDGLSGCINAAVSLAAGAAGDLSGALAGDLLKNGIMLTGGGALIRGLTKRLNDETGVPAHVCEAPQEAVVRGLAVIINDTERFASAVTDWREAGVRI
ncbi:MAG: rod shape-determining protein [Clostridia bacterium]|nr:rod shape-determining protein [Clostridia bacterium]